MREVLSDDGLIDHDAVRHVQKCAPGEESGVQGREPVAVGARQGEEQWLD